LSRVYLDANVFIYAVGDVSPHREACRRILSAVVDGQLLGETSAYTVQEVARQRHRRGDENPTRRAREVASICSVLHQVDRGIVVRALDAVDLHAGLEVSDAIHVATALTHGIRALVSADADFDAIDGIERVDPLDRDRVAALTSE
jgi:hypothetical protein